MKAANVKELVECLKQVPDSAIFYHTHQYLEEYHFLSPQHPSEFARWMSHALENKPLAERLAYIDPWDFVDIASLRDEIIEVLEEYLETNPDLHQAPAGEEFYFIKSTSYILPTGYVAHDLRELMECMGKVSNDSLYFHMYEARLRLGRESNDFSLWLRDCLGENEIAAELDQLDPCYYTLDDLRTVIIKVITTCLERRAIHG